MYYYRILNSVIITLPESVIEIGLDAFYDSIELIIHAPAGRQLEVRRRSTMRKKFGEGAGSICRAYFKRNFMRRKSERKAELSCHTWFSRMDGLLSPQEWIGIARKTGVRAIAITDFQTAAFGEAAQAIEELRRNTGSGALDFKALYGLETVLEDGSLVHLLVRRQEGLGQLYRLLEIAWQDRESGQFLRKTEINAHRTGLLVGCPGVDGELYRGIRGSLDDSRLEKIAGFYDYLSVLPPQHYKVQPAPEQTAHNKSLRPEEWILKTIAIGKRLGKPVAATGNVRTANQDWGMFRTSTAYRIGRRRGVGHIPAGSSLYGRDAECLFLLGEGAGRRDCTPCAQPAGGLL